MAYRQKHWRHLVLRSNARRTDWWRVLACSHFAAAVAATLLTTEAGAGPNRSPAARAEFVKTHPCPATGRTRGACPGWQVDHIQPLKCGGDDSPANMQWLTVADHKAKTAREAKSCRRRS